MTDSDDQTWFDLLAGRATSDNDPVARSEAQQLRQRLLARAAQRPDNEPAQHDRAREDQLIERARFAGLLPQRMVRRSPRRNALSLLAAAALVCVAITAGYQLRNARTPEVVRSGPSEIVRLSATNPLQLKYQIIDELRRVGIAATGYELLGRQGIDADIPQPIADDVRSVLQKYRIPLPADGVLRVEIESEGAP